jgi:pyruvate,water dikinase
MFGSVPPQLRGHPVRRRYPLVALRMPWTFLRIPARLAAAAADTDAWWVEQIARVPRLTLEQAVGLFADSADRFRHNTMLQGTTLFCAVQPMYELLGRLVADTGVGDVTSLASGYGSVPETAVVGDLWRASRGAMDFEQVVARHGFHGPREGELSARVWREDDTSLRRVVAEYTRTPDTSDPVFREDRLRETRLRMERDIVASLPPIKRAPTRVLLRTAARMIPLRGTAKGAFLQAFDVARACARRIGELLAADSVLAEPGDVFYLTESEIVGTAPANPRDLVRRRGERRELYLGYDLPRHWRGRPVPIELATHVDASGGEIAGVGVSPGVAEGVARVVLDPADDVGPGGILVAPTTDPSWSSVMFLSDALVVDMGGALSHAAIVARELGIPCVVNTLNGSRVIRDGDLIRVDGGTGTVRILRRSAAD